MLIQDKITEIYCTADDFCENLAQLCEQIPTLPAANGKRRRNRPHEMSDSEIMTILIMYHFGGFSVPLCSDSRLRIVRQ
jgi:hypothetical protein